MVGTEQLNADMGYVRAAAGRAETVHVRAYGFLWAVILLFGFSLVDFVNDPRWVNRYWMVASPIGSGLSIWLGRRAHRRAGQLDRQASARWILHWLGYVGRGDAWQRARHLGTVAAGRTRPALGAGCCFSR